MLWNSPVLIRHTNHSGCFLLLFFKARLQRGHLLLKQGKLDEAVEDFEGVVSEGLSQGKIEVAAVIKELSVIVPVCICIL